MDNRSDKIEFSESDLEDVSPQPSLGLTDLQVSRCRRPKDGTPYLIFDCVAAEKHNKGCPNCGSIDFVRNGLVPKPRIIHDINIGIIRVDLVVTVPRYRCKDCGAVFNHIFDCAPEGRHMTHRLHEQIRRDAFTRPFKQVATEFGYSEGTIRYIFDEYVNELEAQRGTIIAPEVLGIDEKHIVHEMRGIFVNVKTGRLIEMTPSNKKSDIIGTIESMVGYDTNIKIVTTDMANNYKSYIEECLPNAKIIVDKYHVYQDLYQKITRTRTILMEFIGKKIKDETDPALVLHLRDARDLLVRNAYLFKFGREKLLEKPNRVKAMAVICDTFPEFNHLRLIKEGFERIYDAENRAEAEKLYKEWIPLIPPIGVRQIEAWEKKYGVKADLFAEFRAFARTMTKWHTEIFNYFDPGCQFTNAVSEGTNSLIQRINAMGSGYGFAHLRAKALFREAGDIRYTYSIKTTESSGRPAGRGFHTGMMIPASLNRRAEIVCHIERTTNSALSVLSFVPNNAEYYVFQEDAQDQ